MQRLIRVFTVCKKNIHFSLGISKKTHSQRYLKLELDSSNNVGGSVQSTEQVMLSKLGNNFSRGHFEIFFLFFPENKFDISYKLFP